MSKIKEFRFDDVDNSMDFTAPKEVVESAEIKAAELPEEPVVEVPTKEPKEDEYLAIYDAIMFEDRYEKSYRLGKRYSCVYATRPADADMQINRQLDAMNLQTITAYNTMVSILTLSHSLVELNGKNMREMSISEKYDFLRGKPSQMIELLSNHMVEFDTLVREALAYGEENF